MGYIRLLLERKLILHKFRLLLYRLIVTVVFVDFEQVFTFCTQQTNNVLRSKKSIYGKIRHYPTFIINFEHMEYNFEHYSLVFSFITLNRHLIWAARAWVFSNFSIMKTKVEKKFEVRLESGGECFLKGRLWICMTQKKFRKYYFAKYIFSNFIHFCLF